MEPLDLRSSPPRSPRVQIGGLYMLARTIDRARASLPGGNPGMYDSVDQGLSAALFEALGIVPAEFVATVANADIEENVVAKLRARCADADFDAINARLAGADIRRLPPERRAHIEAKYPPELLESHPLAFDLLEADDREHYPNHRFATVPE
ncbi:MAG: DUF5069 domain-containing protein [Candidatus Velthaea sp.]